MVLKMSSNGARKTLMWTWFGFFVVNLGVILTLYFKQWIESDNLWAAVQQLNSCYVTYLGVMAAFYLSQKATTPGQDQQAGMSFAVAMAGSILWNMVVCGFMMRLVWGSTIEDTIKQIGFFGPILSWLVASAVGFYFGNSAASQNKEGTPPIAPTGA